MCNYREKILRSQDMVLSRYRKQNPVKRLTFEEAYRDDDENKKVIGGVQCEKCGQVFEKLKLLQFHLNRHNGMYYYLVRSMCRLNEPMYQFQV